MAYLDFLMKIKECHINVRPWTPELKEKAMILARFLEWEMMREKSLGEIERWADALARDVCDLGD